MDLRTKLVLALVFVSLAGMLALSAFTFVEARGILRRMAVQHLESVAESKEQELENAITAWRDRVSLIASRTQLRASLESWVRTRRPEHRDRIQTILADALEAAPALRAIVVFDTSGAPVTGAGRVDPRAERATLAPLRDGHDRVRFERVDFVPPDEPEVSFLGAMRRGDRLLGAVRVRMHAPELREITGDRTGLGRTGETLIVQRDAAGNAVPLHPLRHLPDPTGRPPIPAERTDDPAVRALAGQEGTWLEGLRDYRGEPVWAATRYVPELDWGLVVKIDAAEQLAPVRELRTRTVKLAVSLSAFAVVVGILLGLAMAQPILELTEVARRVRAGDLHWRAAVRGEDEIALLARAFNEMTDELLRNQRELEARLGGAPAGEAGGPAAAPGDPPAGDDAGGPGNAPDGPPRGGEPPGGGGGSAPC